MRWITDPDSHEEIEEYFNQLENKPKDNTKNDSEEIKDTSEKDDVNVQDNLLKKENEKLKAEIDNWKNRGKKYKENIQNLKIKCSNLEQENNRVKKENGRLIRENEKTKQGKDTAVKEYNDRIIALSVENSKLKEKIRGKYKPKKNIVLSKTSGVSNPKVLCVTKNPADVLIKGYNIYFLTDLEELNKKIYTETVFDQIWYIRSGLTHADLIKVAEKYANQKILQARDWKALQKKLQGGDRL